MMTSDRANSIKAWGKVLLNNNIKLPLGKSQAMEVGLAILDHASTAALVIGSVLTVVKLCNLLISPERSDNNQRARGRR